MGAIHAHHGLMMPGSGGGGGGVPSTATFHSASVYTGDGTTSRLITGVDMSGGGLFWVKRRDGTNDHVWSFSETGSTVYSTGFAATGTPATGSASFGASGPTLLATTGINVNTNTYAGWQFRKMAGFLDVVPYTGNGANRTIAHSLGVEPAVIVIIRLGSTGSRRVYHRDYGGGGYTNLDATTRFTNDAAFWNSTAATSAVFSLGTSANVNTNTANYVAILFAHDPGNGIAAFNYTGNGSASGPTVSLGFDPRFIAYFGTGPAGAAGSNTRLILDTVRSPSFSGNDALLQNTVAAEQSLDLVSLTGSGFAIGSTDLRVNTSGIVYYGLAIAP